MANAFIAREWEKLCDGVRQSAAHIREQAEGREVDFQDEFQDQAEAFVTSEAPERYDQFLDKVREAAALAVQWQTEAGVADAENATSQADATDATDETEGSNGDSGEDSAQRSAASDSSAS